MSFFGTDAAAAVAVDARAGSCISAATSDLFVPGRYHNYETVRWEYARLN